MTHLLSALALAVAATLPSAPGPQDAQTTATACNQFALDLMGQLGARDGNVFFSPYSIDKTLAMTYAGARGQTAAEMAAVLHLPTDQEKAHRAFAEMRRKLNSGLRGVHISQAAALWGQKGYSFERPFLKLLNDNYEAGMNEVDFLAGDKARGTINAWVNKQTSGKIPELFGPDTLGANTRLVLTSAIYFKGDWLRQFKKDSTSPENFYPGGDRKVQVQMMSQTDSFGYAEVEGAQVLQMPYVGKDLAMLVLLPEKKDGLADFEKSLTAEKLAAWTGRLREQRVQVWFPRFKTETAYELPEALQALGMKAAFVPGGADFSGMNGGRDPMWIDKVIHKAFIDVAELGTEAAAATGVVMHALSASPAAQGPRIPIFYANHPFLFAIRDVRTGLVLFLGRYAQP